VPYHKLQCFTVGVQHVHTDAFGLIDSGLQWKRESSFVGLGPHGGRESFEAVPKTVLLSSALDAEANLADEFERGGDLPKALPIRDHYFSHVPSGIGSFGHLPHSILDSAPMHCTLPFVPEGFATSCPTIFDDPWEVTTREMLSLTPTEPGSTSLLMTRQPASRLPPQFWSAGQCHGDSTVE